MTDSMFQGIPEQDVISFSTTIARKVKSYFSDETHRKDFEKWYEEKHGTPYVWEDEYM